MRGISFAVVLRTALMSILSLSAARSGEKTGQDPPTPPRPIPSSRQASDVVVLRDGTVVHGFVLRASEDRVLRMAVRRAWLKEHAADCYKQAVRDEPQRQRTAAAQLRDRILAWQQQHREPVNFAAFLKQQFERTEKLLNDGETNPEAVDTELLVVEFPRGQIRRRRLQSPERRQAFLHAWAQRLREPEERPFPELAEELNVQGVDFRTQPADLSGRFPIFPEDERAWAIRVALVEYDFLRKPDYQGTQEVLLRADDPTARISLQSLEAALSQLELPAADVVAQPAVDRALHEAQREGLRGMRITQVQHDFTRDQVIVAGRFFAFMPDGSWQMIWQHRQLAEVSQPRAQLEQQIAGDAQVQTALQAARLLGVADDATLTYAIRVGAATLEAQAAVHASFQQLLSPFSRDLLAAPATFTEFDAAPPIPARRSGRRMPKRTSTK